MAIKLYPIIASAWVGELLMPFMWGALALAFIGILLLLTLNFTEMSREKQELPRLSRWITVPLYILGALMSLSLVIVLIIIS